MSDCNQLSKNFSFYAPSHDLVLEDLEKKLDLNNQFTARRALADCFSNHLNNEFFAPKHIEDKLAIFNSAIKAVLDTTAGTVPVAIGSSGKHILRGKFEKYPVPTFFLMPRPYQYVKQISAIERLFFIFIILDTKNAQNTNTPSIATKMRLALYGNLLPVKTIQLVPPQIRFGDLKPLRSSLNEMKKNDTNPRESAFAEILSEIVNDILNTKPVGCLIKNKQIDETFQSNESFKKIDDINTKENVKPLKAPVEESSKEWITKNQSVTPNDFRLFVDPERHGLIDELVANIKNGDNKTRDASALVLLSFVIGQDINTVKELQFGYNGSLTYAGEYCREIKIPADAYIPPNESSNLRPRAITVNLPLPPVIKRWLSTLPNSNEKLIDCLDTPLNELDKSIKNVLNKIKRKLGQFRIRQEKICAALHLTLTLLYRDESINYIITRKKNHDAPTSSYYICHEICFIQRAYASALEKMLLGSCIEDEYKNHIESFVFAESDLVTGYYPSAEALISFPTKALEKLNAAKKKKDIVETHNTYVDYCLALLMIGTAHRPVEDPFPKHSHIEPSCNLIIVSDKVTYKRSNWRLAGIPDTAIKQIELYQYYLCALPSKLGALSSEIADQIAKYVSGDEEVLPQFFYLEQKNQLKVVSVTQARMKKRWKGIWDFPINFTRHIAATELMRLTSCGELVKAQLGHNYDGSDRFGKNSTLAPKSFFAATSKYLEQILIENNWSAIKSPLRKTAPYSFENHGNNQKIYNFAYKRRESARRVKRQKRIEKAQLAIQEHLEIILGKTDLQTITEYEHDDLMLAIDNETNPNREQQHKALKYLIHTKTINVKKEEPVYSTWVNKIEASPMREHSIRKYQIALKARQFFLVHINTQTETIAFDDNLRLAEITVSGAIFGGLHNAQLLENLFDSIQHVLHKHSGSTLIDFSEYAKTMHQRRIWFLDPMTTGLVLALNKIKPLNSSKFNEQKYLRHLADLLQKIQAHKIKEKLNCFECLEQIGQTLAFFEMPGFLREFTSGRLKTTSLSLDSIVRANSKMALDTTPDASEHLGLQDKYFIPTLNDKRGSHGVLKFKQRFSKPKQDILLAPNEKRCTYNNRCKNELYGFLKKDFITNEFWSIDSKLIGGFVMFLCKEGTSKKRNAAYLTVVNYSDAIVRFYIKCMNKVELENRYPSEIDWQVLFENAISHTFNRQGKSMRNVLRQFHRYLRKKHVVKDIDWSRIYNIDLTNAEDPSVDANYVSESEYFIILDMILNSSELNEIERLQTALIALFGYRFGLRITETHGLLNRDVINDEILALVIVQNSIKPIKNDDASRRVVSTETNEFTELERELLNRYLSIQQRNMIANRSSPFFRDGSYNSTGIISKDHASRLINALLKEITGDTSIRFHHLRHSRATNSIGQNIKPFDYNLLKTDRAAFNTHFYHLREVAVSMGHAHDTTTLMTYTHCLDSLVLDWLPDFTHMLNDRGYAYILSMKYDSVRTKRRRNKNVESSPASLLSPRENKGLFNLLPSHNIKLIPYVGSQSTIKDANGTSTDTLLELAAIVFDYATTSESISDYMLSQNMQKYKTAIVVSSLCEIEQECGFALFQFNSRKRACRESNNIILQPSEVDGSQKILEQIYTGKFVENRDKNNLANDLGVWVRTFHAASQSNLLEDCQQYNRLMMLFMNYFSSPDMHLNFNSSENIFLTETSSKALVKVDYRCIPAFRDQGKALINKTAQLKVKQVRKRNISSIVIFIICSYIRILEKKSSLIQPSLVTQQTKRLTND